MKFNLETSGDFYKAENIKDLEKLGFEFKEHDFKGGIPKYMKIHNEALTIEINSLDELLALTKEHGDIVIEPPDQFSELYTLEIYDDYRE